MLENQEFSPHKEAEQDPEKVAKKLFSGEKLKEVITDEETKEAFFAFVRLLINVGISAVDLVPGIGELPSWVADGIKTLKEASKIGKKGAKKKDPESTFWAKIDPTPDVPLWIALGSESLEIPSGSAFPSHAVETVIQAGHDIPKIAKGLKRIKEIYGDKVVKKIGENADRELRDYKDNKGEIDTALGAFNQ